MNYVYYFIREKLAVNEPLLSSFKITVFKLGCLANKFLKFKLLKYKKDITFTNFFST